MPLINDLQTGVLYRNPTPHVRSVHAPPEKRFLLKGPCPAPSRSAGDSSGSASLREGFSAVRKRRDDLLLLTGNEFDVLGCVETGFDGGLLGTGILDARMIRNALEALQAGDRETATAWQERSNAFLAISSAPTSGSGWAGSSMPSSSSASSPPKPCSWTTQ